MVDIACTALDIHICFYFISVWIISFSKMICLSNFILMTIIKSIILILNIINIQWSRIILYMVHLMTTLSIIILTYIFVLCFSLSLSIIILMHIFVLCFSLPLSIIILMYIFLLCFSLPLFHRSITRSDSHFRGQRVPLSNK